jgi:hypothetical protein
MSKAHRGKGLVDQVKGGRGACPACQRTGIKVLYSVTAGEAKRNVCKECNKAISRGKKSL